MKFMPHALKELRQVVKDKEGAQQSTPWIMLVEVAAHLKDLETEVWALESGMQVLDGTDKLGMQQRLKQIRRGYGRIYFEASRGRRLSKRGVTLEMLSKPEKKESVDHYELARKNLEVDGYSGGSHYLPTGRFELDGEPFEIVAGEDTTLEVDSSASVTFTFELAGLAGPRGGGEGAGGPGFITAIEVAIGPRIKLSNATSLLVLARLIGGLSSSSTPDEGGTPKRSAGVTPVMGGSLELGLEFQVGAALLSPRLGYSVQALPRGLNYPGRAISTTGADIVLLGTYIVPSVAHGPRLGFQVHLKPGAKDSAHMPGVFFGLRGGPLWLKPTWGSLLGDGRFDIGEGSSEWRAKIDNQAAQRGLLFAELHGVIGIRIPHTRSPLRVSRSDKRPYVHSAELAMRD
jgi:hypothetical protein